MIFFLYSTVANNIKLLIIIRHTYFGIFNRNFESDSLTTVSDAKAGGHPMDVYIVSPGCHIDEEVRWVSNGEAKSEPVYTSIWNSGI